MSKHTPGKWERELAQDGEHTGPGDNPPGYAGDDYETNSVGVLDPETGEWTPVADCYRGGDADLICAAPDMLAALEAAFDALGSDSTGLVLAARSQVAAAITKATKGDGRAE